MCRANLSCRQVRLVYDIVYLYLRDVDKPTKTMTLVKQSGIDLMLLNVRVAICVLQQRSASDSAFAESADHCARHSKCTLHAVCMGNWTTRGSGNSRIDNSRTSQLADMSPVDICNSKSKTPR